MRLVNYVLDTNFIYSILEREDPNSLDACKIFHKIYKNGRLLVPYIVAAELMIGKDVKEINEALVGMRVEIKLNNIDDLDYLKKIDIFRRKSLKANDCLIIALCDRLNATLVTFDKKLQKTAQELGINHRSQCQLREKAGM
jgi:predicted nucleic acid-binding protein